ncbi:MAG TPA: hypothetical protein VKZ51_12940, partial [Cyclobacteriaceae bacterium]|nr:hypothetical protein [Cyclobacteriaceae bacterium]
MKIPNISINIVFVIVGAVFSSFLAQSSFSQGFNNNEWIFGYCEGTDNNYISFGKDGIAKVNTLPAANTFGKGNAAMAVDPVTGQVLFYTDGALVYNYLNLAMQGVVGELGGSETGRQTVAISELDYSEGGGNKLFYVFFLNTTGELEYAVADMNNQGGAQANQPPAGAISPGGTLGPASGSILVVKSAGSPNFLISFENGSLVSREIGETEGDFTQQGNLP